MGKMGATSEEQERVLVSLTDVSEAVISARQNTFLAAMVGRLESFPERMRMGELEGMRVSPDTVIIGTHDALFWALHRLKFPATDSDGLNEAHMLAKTYQFWAWGRPAGLAAFGAAAAGNGTVKNIRFGANLRDGFRMDMMLETTDPDSAARVLESTRKGAPREMQFAVEGNAAHLVVAYDRETTLRRFGGFLSDSIGKRFAPLVTAARNIAAQKPHAAARPAPGKIVIDGLDDGPRQVSLGTKQ
jgi:hypothetical protein